MNNIVFTIKDTKFYVPVLTLSTRAIKNYSNFSAKDLNAQLNARDMKQELRIKIREMSTDILSNQIFLESIDYLF